VKAIKSAIGFLFLSGALCIYSGTADAKDQSKQFTNRHGGEAPTHMSRNGMTHNNAQWSADPTRGWVRAEERHELKNPSVPSKHNSDKGKQKAKAKTKAS
jgi:hypothetical protein